jgi:hypothetical protein
MRSCVPALAAGDSLLGDVADAFGSDRTCTERGRVPWRSPAAAGARGHRVGGRHLPAGDSVGLDLDTGSSSGSGTDYAAA